MLAATGDYVSVEIPLERLVGSAQLTKPRRVLEDTRHGLWLARLSANSCETRCMILVSPASAIVK